MEKIKKEIAIAKNKLEALKYSRKNFGQGSQQEMDFLENKIKELERQITINNISSADPDGSDMSRQGGGNPFRARNDKPETYP